MRAVGKTRVKILVEVTQHSVGSKEGTVSAIMQIRMLLENYESRNERLQEVMTLIEELVNQILMEEMLLIVQTVTVTFYTDVNTDAGSKSVINTIKTELVVGRKSFIGHRSRKRAKLPSGYEQSGRRKLGCLKTDKILMDIVDQLPQKEGYTHSQ